MKSPDAIATAYSIADIPSVMGRDRRVVAIDEAGTRHVFHFWTEVEAEGMPAISFTPAHAQQAARDVLARKERTVTASRTLDILAAAVIADESEKLRTLAVGFLRDLAADCRRPTADAETSLQNVAERAERMAASILSEEASE